MNFCGSVKWQRFRNNYLLEFMFLLKTLALGQPARNTTISQASLFYPYSIPVPKSDQARPSE